MKQHNGWFVIQIVQMELVLDLLVVYIILKIYIKLSLMDTKYAGMFLLFYNIHLLN